MIRAIVGTAGHVDHGKTALVRALTGVDTDRLPEEKARGITLDLGFAELAVGNSARVGVVDVPGHEDLVRTMVAGASGMDVALLVVAADEGVMPQTREHVDILALLDVPRMVVALSKADLVDPEWLALVEEEVRELLAPTPFADAPMVPTSATRGDGLELLRVHLTEAAARARARAQQDLARLPVDRSFTVQGMGTVVTGTLWTGVLAAGDRVRLLPSGHEARIRSLQVHGRDTPSAAAGERTALALSGLDRREVHRGDVVVSDPSWMPARMLTARVRVLPGAPRALEDGDRVRVLAGTAEVMARCAVLESQGTLPPGGTGWVQLRLEEPALTRAGDRLVLRAYSPLATLGGGVVAEAIAPKRRRLGAPERRALESLLAPEAAARLEGALELAGWGGLRAGALPQATGLPPGPARAAVEALAAGASLTWRDTVFAPGVAKEAERLVLEALEDGHRADPLRPSVSLERLRQALPGWASPALAEGAIGRLAARGALVLADGGARLPGFAPTPTPDQEEACRALRDLYGKAALAPPFLDELPAVLRTRPDLPQLLRFLEAEGSLRSVDDGLWFAAPALAAAAREVEIRLGGRTGLGPADFRDVLPVSRRHLLPLLAWLDGTGVTRRSGALREVPGPQ